MVKKGNPVLIQGLVNLGGQLVSTIMDKRAEKKKNALGEEEILESESLSLTRLSNVVGTPVIIGFALNDMMSQGINKNNLLVLGIGVVYSVGLGVVTYLKERGK